MLDKMPRAALALSITLALGACGGSSSGVDSTANGTVSLADTPAPATMTGTPLSSPAAGTSRPGQVYSIDLIGEGTGDTVGITVFEPTTLVGGQKYPLVLQSHGYAGSRVTSASPGATDPILGSSGIPELLAAGYGAISISERGSDESTGTIRVMDPDFEGKDLISVLDWAEHNLDWLMYGPSVDGSDPHNLVVGSFGGSYGGMYQYLIHNIDPKRRLDAIVPLYAPNDLTYALFPNNAIKAGWDSILFVDGDTAGSDLDRGHTDPYIVNSFVSSFAANTGNPDLLDFFYYHSNQYFCGTKTVATNGQVGASIGGAGTVAVPGHAPVRGSKVNALLFQGMRDTLFTFNDGYHNYQCLAGEGGDVRLLSFQAGHNTLQAVPDPGNHLYQPPGNEFDQNCGTINVYTAAVAFFDQYLKGIPGAADKLIPTQNCLSLTKGDGVLVDHVTTGTSGMEVDIPSTNVVAGGDLDVPIAIPLGITASDGEVIGGIPYLQVDVEKLNAALPGEPILYFGIGQTRNGVPGNYDLIDNQLAPVRGTGVHSLDMTGIAERLAAGDQLALLVYGQHDQYHATGTVNAADPAVMPVTVIGKVWVPMLGNLPKITQ